MFVWVFKYFPNSGFVQALVPFDFRACSEFLCCFFEFFIFFPNSGFVQTLALCDFWISSRISLVLFGFFEFVPFIRVIFCVIYVI